MRRCFSSSAWIEPVGRGSEIDPARYLQLPRAEQIVVGRAWSQERRNRHEAVVGMACTSTRSRWCVRVLLRVQRVDIGVIEQVERLAVERELHAVGESEFTPDPEINRPIAWTRVEIA